LPFPRTSICTRCSYSRVGAADGPTPAVGCSDDCPQMPADDGVLPAALLVLSAAVEAAAAFVAVGAAAVLAMLIVACVHARMSNVNGISASTGSTGSVGFAFLAGALNLEVRCDAAPVLAGCWPAVALLLLSKKELFCRPRRSVDA